MAIETEELIKIIIAIIIIAAVIIGVYLFFKNQIIDFFNGLSAGKPEIFLTLVK